MTRDYSALFFPRSIAVVGASPNPRSPGGAVLRNLVEGGYAGELFAVHPGHGNVHGVPCVAQVQDGPTVPEMAVLAVAPDRSGPLLQGLLAAGTRCVVSIASTLPPAPQDSAVPDKAFWRDRFHAAGALLLGPNCMGLHAIGENQRLDASFSRVRPIEGTTAIFSQSGSVGEWLLVEGTRRGVGISAYASVGDGVVIGILDLLHALPTHFPKVDRVLLYLESLPDPAALGKSVAGLAADTQVFALLGGTSDVGRRAAAAHTGAVPHTSDAETQLARAGVTTVHGLSDAVDVLAAHQQVRTQGRRVAVVTNAGGPGVLAADRLRAFGAELPPLSDELGRSLGLPGAASVKNPIDLLATAGPKEYAATLRALARSPEVDAVLVIFMAPVFTPVQPVLDAVENTLRDEALPGLICLMGLEGTEHPTAFADPQAAAGALARVLRG